MGVAATHYFSVKSISITAYLPAFAFNVFYSAVFWHQYLTIHLASYILYHVQEICCMLNI